MPGPRPRSDTLGDRAVGNRFQRHLAVENGGAQFAMPSRVALFNSVRQLATLDHRRCVEQAASDRVHGSDMGVEQVGRFDALPADFGIEVILAGLLSYQGRARVRRVLDYRSDDP